MMAGDRETRERERAGEKRQDQETSEVVSKVKDLIKVLNTKQESEGNMSQLESEKSTLGGGGTPNHRKGSDNCESSEREIISENKRGEGGFNPQQTEKIKVKSERGRGGSLPSPKQKYRESDQTEIGWKFQEKV